MLEVTKVNAMSLIALLKAIEAAHPAKKRIHVYLDNASYHHANIVRDWLKEQHRKSVLHFIPPYCPHLDPIEQCWALMHQHTTHNRDYETFRQFKRAILKFLKHTIPKNWNRLCDRITDNFRVIHRDKFRVVA
jgi:transposase